MLTTDLRHRAVYRIARDVPSKTPGLTIRFDTREFRLNHGAEPRGTGRWGFALTKLPIGEDAIFWAHGTLAQAKREATGYYRALLAGYPQTCIVWVQP